ncbi:3-deoxy-7-phosphoheptulonate synthase [Streptomyces sp. W16]|uniref:3-deoxy-7-phosphoheptulonate synthase n=1 Tax=Streptomyces sp. W16 TaxID=3076631 RepID=UPI003FA345B5
MTNESALLIAEDESSALSSEELKRWSSLPADQQPDWPDDSFPAETRAVLANRPGLVGREEIRTLRALLAGVAEGRFQVVQAGDCAEDPAECAPGPVSRKIGLLDAVAGVMRINSDKPVIRVGRIAGQFAKPRSRPTETVGGAELPVYRGHMVNQPEPDAEARRPDPLRMLACYEAAFDAVSLLRERSGDAPVPMDSLVWTSHEALILDYELPLLRRAPDGRLLLSSTHWPWIGERTRQPDGAHVQLLGSVVNPVSCKVGPTVTAEELVALCRVLDPDREPGRLTFVARMGADKVAAYLPPLVAAARAAGHPVIWMCDPMHANTVSGPDGVKTRLVDTVAREVEAFCQVVAAAGGVVGGLHLETTPHEVDECVADHTELDRVGSRAYTTFCDPRLNPWQALEVASAWRG